MDDEVDRRLCSPAVARNRDAILAVLRDVLPARGKVLEIASGSGEHALYAARHLPTIRWQPSDPSPQALASIAAWRDAEPLDNLLEPLQLDVTVRPWPLRDFDALVCINMIHIAPWEAAQALFIEAGERLGKGGVLYLYGPFKRDGQHTAESNAVFDADLRRRDPRWGIRDLNNIEALAGEHGLSVDRIVEMPANNLSLVLRK
ncbi:DUF938 domain-containing protein [Halomonas sp. GXIMD04776]|uniref:DUF938 domain-containing protein n=1 Tax=Halomonas sp. GXIMD04776 TaxID=3415605 RepID=UPI003C941685